MTEISGFTAIGDSETQEPSRILTGFRDLDILMGGGLYPSDLIILGGVPGVGKSDFVLNVASYATSLKEKVALFSLQNPRDRLHERILSIQSGIDTSRIWHFIVRQYPPFKETLTEISGLPLYINDETGLSFDNLRDKVLNLRAAVGIDLLLIDSLQRIDTAPRSRYPLPRLLKALAQELVIPVLATTQLTRAIGKRYYQRPMSSDLMGGRITEEMADVVLLMQKEDFYEDPNENPDNWLNFTMDAAKIIIAKSRRGPQSENLLRYNTQTGRLMTIPHLDWEHNEVVGYIP